MTVAVVLLDFCPFVVFIDRSKDGWSHRGTDMYKLCTMHTHCFINLKKTQWHFSPFVDTQNSVINVLEFCLPHLRWSEQQTSAFMNWLHCWPFFVSISSREEQNRLLFIWHCHRLYWTHLSLSLSVCRPADSSSSSLLFSLLRLSVNSSVGVWTQLSDTFVLLCGSAGVIVDWLICCDTLLLACQSQGRPGGTTVACRNAEFTSGWICLFYSLLPQVPWICHVGSQWYEACSLKSCRQQEDMLPLPSS